MSLRIDDADWLQDHGVGLKAISQGIDTTTLGGRLFFHLLATIAEFEYDLIVERPGRPRRCASQRPHRRGRIKMTPTKAQQARSMYGQKIYTVQEIAETLGVSRGTIYRHLAHGTGGDCPNLPEGRDCRRCGPHRDLVLAALGL